jgi:L-asparaginase II
MRIMRGSMGTPETTACGAPIAEVSRGRQVESRHFGHIVAVDTDGRALFAFGDPDRPTYPRSALKPIQALAGVLNGIDQRFGFSTAELAVVCASHQGELRHRLAVQSILDKIGATEADLHYGLHAPADVASRDELIRSGRGLTPIYNDCSGKHAGMLALARVLGAEMQGYWNFDHPVQQQIRSTYRQLCGDTSSHEVQWAVDGCAIPTYLMTLRQLATGFARLSQPERLDPVWADATRRVTGAMMAEPDMVGGAEARDSILMRSLPHRIVAKAGAEGVQALGLIGRGIGIAIKVEDGSQRPLWPVCFAILQRLDHLPDPLPTALMDFRQPEIRNTRNEPVGFVSAGRCVHAR